MRGKFQPSALAHDTNTLQDFNSLIYSSLGGKWRIHRTVNARNVEKARKWLLHDLIEHPEHSSYIDSRWKTALLQCECKATYDFMLDIDTKDQKTLNTIDYVLNRENVYNIAKFESPNGWHYITPPFDTREVCKIDKVTLIRDGYYFICEVGENK